MKISIASLLFLGVLSFACNNNSSKKTTMKDPVLVEDNFTYTLPDFKDSLTMDGFVAYDKNVNGKRPAILVVHEWWGLNDYAKMRVRELAKMGYIAMALDLYGNGKRGTTPSEAGNLAGPFYQDPSLAKDRFEAALLKLKSYPETDQRKIVAIGYCFGGTQVLNMANMGENLLAVVSFHGGLKVVTPENGQPKAKILVCHGEADQFVLPAEVNQFKKLMDSVGASYVFKSYKDATHAFSNPGATEMGEKFKMPIKYNAAADTASWNDMKTFFASIFD